MSPPSGEPATPPEAVHLIADPASGLEGAIVLHSTRLGPAAGGCRLWRYDGSASLTRDAVRLAEGMAYKNALADLPLGGGKAVIQLPRGQVDRKRLFEAFGRAVQDLAGDYVTAEDVGTSVTDMEAVASQTRFVAGLPPRLGQVGGDPSPWTALGVFVSIEAAVRRRLGTDLRGLTVAVQGLGHVGTHLCERLHAAGARLVVSDIRADAVEAMCRRYGASAADPENIVAAKCEVFAPCALGAVIDRETVGRLRAQVVCGAANNVLATGEDGDRLADRGVIYAPDYVVNAGGIINVAAEYLGWTAAEVDTRVRATGTRLSLVLDRADASGLPPHRAADLLARRAIAEGAGRARARAA